MTELLSAADDATSSETCTLRLCYGIQTSGDGRDSQRALQEVDEFVTRKSELMEFEKKFDQSTVCFVDGDSDATLYLGMCIKV